MTTRIERANAAPCRFTWCQDVVDEVLAKRASGMSYTQIAHEMQASGTFITRCGVAGMLYREARGGPKHGRATLTPEQLPLDAGEGCGCSV